MSTTEWIIVVAAVAVAPYGGFVAALLFAGRREAARGLAGFVPDCVVLFRRLLVDTRVRKRHKLLLGALIGYLALPFDIVPDFIPVAGQLDDAIVAGFVLRAILRGGGPTLVREHWQGPADSLALVLRLAGHAPPRGLIPDARPLPPRRDG
jgi:uncharacterized membrane protein YkvA (DUF1232 family)